MRLAVLATWIAIFVAGCGPEGGERLRSEAQALREQARWVPDLASEDVARRREAAKALGRMAPLDRATIAMLAQALGDRDRWVREAAAVALREQGPGAAAAVPALVTALGDADEYVRWRVAEALGRIGPAAAAAREALAVHAGDPDEVEVVKAASQRALERIGPASAPEGGPTAPAR